jgi:hypothetical protein
MPAAEWLDSSLMTLSLQRRPTEYKYTSGVSVTKTLQLLLRFLTSAMIRTLLDFSAVLDEANEPSRQFMNAITLAPLQRVAR